MNNTEKYSHELIVPNEDLPFKMFLFEGSQGNYFRDKHWHRSIEIFAVYEGGLTFYINEEKRETIQKDARPKTGEIRSAQRNQLNNQPITISQGPNWPLEILALLPKAKLPYHVPHHC